jgi:hypothetical protein
LRFYHREQQLYLLPGQFLTRFPDLPYYAFGFPFGRWSGSHFELSAEISQPLWRPI